MATVHILTGTITAGVWEGSLATIAGGPPNLRATHEGDALDGLEVTQSASGDHWILRLPLPAMLISDGVQTVLIRDEGDQVLARIAILAGASLAEDLRAEIALLRAELDMLKQSFRQHCDSGE